MKIPEFYSTAVQEAKIGRHIWSIARLFELTNDLPVMETPLDHLYVWHKYPNLTLRQMVMHMKTVQAADLSCPIILDEDGEIMDGRHRIMKAILQGEKTIKAVRFDENPEPCRILED